MSNTELAYLRVPAVPAEFMNSPVKTAPIPAAFAPTPVKNGGHDSLHTQTVFRKIDSDSSGVCSDISFHVNTPDNAPMSASMSSLPRTPRPTMVRIGEGLMGYSHNGSCDPFTQRMFPFTTNVAPPSPYADSEISSPIPKLPSQFADSDQSPEHVRLVSKPIGLQAFCQEDGYLSALNSVSPKRHRFSSECQEENEDSDDPLSDGFLCSPDEVDQLLSTSSSGDSPRCEVDTLTDFEAVNIKWTYGCHVFTVSDYAQDIYDMWRHSERTRGFTPDFLATQKDVSEELRRELLLHVLSFRRNLEITHETLHLAVYLFDRCLDTFYVKLDNARDLAAVSLVIASKLEDYSPLKLVDVIRMDIVERDALDHAEKLKKISRLEKRVLGELGYSLTFVTPFMFMNFFHQQLRSCLYTIQLSNYILELCFLSTKYRNIGGAFTAHAVVCLAKAIVCSSTTEEAVTVVEQTELVLSPACRIAVGSTRYVMRLLVEDMQQASVDQNEIWQEYGHDDRCSVSTYSPPHGLFDQLLARQVASQTQ